MSKGFRRIAECGLGSNIIVRMPVSMIKFIKRVTFFSSILGKK